MLRHFSLPHLQNPSPLVLGVVLGNLESFIRELFWFLVTTFAVVGFVQFCGMSVDLITGGPSGILLAHHHGYSYLVESSWQLW